MFVNENREIYFADVILKNVIVNVKIVKDFLIRMEDFKYKIIKSIIVLNN